MARKPHVLFIANGVLGWSTYARQFEAALRARKDIDVTVHLWKPPRWAMVLARRHADTRLSRTLRPFDPITFYAGPLGKTIREAVSKSRPDIVHVAAHWPGGAFLGRDMPPMTLALDATRPAISRDLPLPGWRGPEIETEGVLCRAAAHLFPMSEWAARSLEGDFGIAPEQITVLPPSLDPANWPAPVQPGRDGGLPQIIFVGNDLRRKGADRLVNWVSGPLAGRCHLHIVSSDSRPLPPSPYVKMHGQLSHKVLLQELLPRMDIFCLPTRLDMSPFVLVEAAAAGLPVVASRLAGIPDLVVDGETGLLVDPGNDQGFISAISALLDDRAVRSRMGQLALLRAKRTFDGEANFDRLIETLLAIPGRRAARA